MKSLNKSILMVLFLGIFSNNFFGSHSHSSHQSEAQSSNSLTSNEGNMIINNPKTSMGVFVVIIIIIGVVGYYFWPQKTKGKEEEIDSKQQ